MALRSAFHGAMRGSWEVMDIFVNNTCLVVFAHLLLSWDRLLCHNQVGLRRRNYLAAIIPIIDRGGQSASARRDGSRSTGSRGSRGKKKTFFFLQQVLATHSKNTSSGPRCTLQTNIQLAVADNRVLELNR